MRSSCCRTPAGVWQTGVATSSTDCMSSELMRGSSSCPATAASTVSMCWTRSRVSLSRSMYSSSTPSVYGSLVPKAWSSTLPPGGNSEPFPVIEGGISEPLMRGRYLPCLQEESAGPARRAESRSRPTRRPSPRAGRRRPAARTSRTRVEEDRAVDRSARARRDDDAKAAVDASSQRRADEVVHRFRSEERDGTGSDDAPRRAGGAIELLPRDEGESDADRVHASACGEMHDGELDLLLRADLRREYDDDGQPRENGQSHSGRSASASISTFQAGSSSPAITSIDVAGSTGPNISPCARPTASQSAGSTMKLRVRTTCSGAAPSSRRASPMIVRQRFACSYGSSDSRPTGAVPLT